MDVGTIIGLISAGLALLGTAVTLVFKLYQAIKTIVKDKDWKKIMSIALKAIEAAEKSGKSGADKKAQVIEAVKAGCKEVGVDCDQFMDDLSKYIDDIIGFTNDMADAKKEGKKAIKESV